MNLSGLFTKLILIFYITCPIIQAFKVKTNKRQISGHSQSREVKATSGSKSQFPLSLIESNRDARLHKVKPKNAKFMNIFKDVNGLKSKFIENLSKLKKFKLKLNKTSKRKPAIVAKNFKPKQNVNHKSSSSNNKSNIQRKHKIKAGKSSEKMPNVSQPSLFRRKHSKSDSKLIARSSKPTKRITRKRPLKTTANLIMKKIQNLDKLFKEFYN